MITACTASPEPKSPTIGLKTVPHPKIDLQPVVLSRFPFARFVGKPALDLARNLPRLLQPPAIWPKGRTLNLGFAKWPSLPFSRQPKFSEIAAALSALVSVLNPSLLTFPLLSLLYIETKREKSQKNFFCKYILTKEKPPC